MAEKTKTKGVTITIDGELTVGVTRIGGPGWKVDLEEVTELGDGWKQFLSTLAEADEIPISFNFNSDEHGRFATIRDNQAASGEPVPCTINFPAPSSKSYPFNAWVTAFKHDDLEAGKVIKGSATLKPDRID